MAAGSYRQRGAQSGAGWRPGCRALSTELDVLVNPWLDPAFIWIHGLLCPPGVPAVRELLGLGMAVAGERCVVVDAVDLRCATPDCWSVVLDLAADRAPGSHVQVVTRPTTRRRLAGMLEFGQATGRAPTVPRRRATSREPVAEGTTDRRRPWWRHRP